MRLRMDKFGLVVCCVSFLNAVSALDPKGLAIVNLNGAIVVWNLISLGLALASPKTSTHKDRKEELDKWSKRSQIIDDILRKAEIERAKKKEEEQKGINKVGDRQLDPIKCFPKALCGVSSEVEQISKKSKNGLINEYLILMKAVKKHPEFLDDIVSKKKKKKKKKGGNDDIESDLVVNDNTSDSEEDDIESYEEADEEEEDDLHPKKEDKPLVPNDDEEFHKEYLKEKLEMEKLMAQTLKKEQKEADKFPWDTVHSSSSHRPWQGYGHTHNNRPGPQSGSYSEKPSWSWGFGSPLSSIFFRRGEQQNDPSENMGEPSKTASGFKGVSSFFKNLFGFGESSLTNDPWFPSAARDLSGEIAPGLAVDDTREILETALDVGRTFERPSQCNEIFNACDYDYTELLLMIDDLRQNVRDSVKKAQSGKDLKTAKGQKRKKKKEKAKSQLPKKNVRQKKKMPKKTYSSISEEYSGEIPNRYVIPVTTAPPPTFAERFSGALSWLGLSKS